MGTPSDSVGNAANEAWDAGVASAEATPDPAFAGADATFGTGNDADTDAAEAAVEHDVDALLAERDSFKDIALRLQADFDNYRKRVAAQHADEVDRATGKLAESLLGVLDATEAAYVLHPTEVGPLLNTLLGELRKAGLEAMDLHGQPFDPNLADAVLHDAGDGTTDGPAVSEVLRTGYLWKGRVLRPAMVKVTG